MDELKAWLEKVGARRRWTVGLPARSRIDAYQIGAGIALVQVIVDGDSGEDLGFELFVPAALEDRIDTTFEAAERALKLDTTFDADDEPSWFQKWARVIEGV